MGGQVSQPATAGNGGAALDADRIGSLEEARLWAVEHDAKGGALWSQQGEINAKMDKWRREMYGRIDHLERRLVFASGVASAVGAVAGVIGSLIGVAAFLR